MNLDELKKHSNCYYYTKDGVLLCGDCVKLLPEIDCCVDMVVTSPPYGELRDYKGYNFIFKDIAKGLYHVMTAGGTVVWVVGDAVENGGETGESFRQALYFKELGFNLYDTMIYEKPSIFKFDKRRYQQCFEYMFVLSKGRPRTVNLIKDRKNKKFQQTGCITLRLKDGKLNKRRKTPTSSYGARRNIWVFSVGYLHSSLDKVAFEHPAIFPEKLAGDHILSWSDEGDIVLDPMVGSGTTLKMATILNRRWIGIDISEEYCEIAKQRIELEVKRPRISKLIKHKWKMPSFTKRK